MRFEQFIIRRNSTALNALAGVNLVIVIRRLHDIGDYAQLGAELDRDPSDRRLGIGSVPERLSVCFSAHKFRNQQNNATRDGPRRLYEMHQY